MRPDPYCSPSIVPAPELTRFEILLLRYLVVRHSRPSLLAYLQFRFRYILICVGLVAFVYAFPVYLIDHPSIPWLAGFFAFGLALGLFACFFGECVAQVRGWPLLDRVIDWDRVNELYPYSS